MCTPEEKRKLEKFDKENFESAMQSIRKLSMENLEMRMSKVVNIEKENEKIDDLLLPVVKEKWYKKILDYFKKLFTR